MFVSHVFYSVNIVWSRLLSFILILPFHCFQNRLPVVGGAVGEKHFVKNSLVKDPCEGGRGKRTWCKNPSVKNYKLAGGAGGKTHSVKASHVKNHMWGREKKRTLCKKPPGKPLQSGRGARGKSTL